MKLSPQSRSITYLKANAPGIIRELTMTRAPLMITEKGVAKAVLQDIDSYEQTQETLAMLKILARGNQQIDAGKTIPVRHALRRIRGKAAKRAGKIRY